MRPSSPAEPSRPKLSELDTFLVQCIRAKPKIRFGGIVKAAREARGVPRTTAARHLARLVRWGEVMLLPERAYIVGEPDAPGARAVVEVRWYNVVVVIRPNGDARIVSDEELRMAAGRLDHIEFNHPKPPKQFVVWTTIPGKLSTLPPSESPSGLPVHRIDFTTPLTARDATWQRVSVSVEWPSWYRMAGPESRASSKRNRPGAFDELQSIEIASLGRRFERRLTPDARVRLQVVFPECYPLRGVRCRVRFHSETDRIDQSEEDRVIRLSTEADGPYGLKKFGTTITLTVPKPMLDRHYTIEWRLPTGAQYRRWQSALLRNTSRLSGRAE